MPQLVPFYFVNQLVWGYGVLLIILFMVSKIVLPRLLVIYLSRIFISKL